MATVNEVIDMYLDTTKKNKHVNLMVKCYEYGLKVVEIYGPSEVDAVMKKSLVSDDPEDNVDLTKEETLIYTIVLETIETIGSTLKSEFGITDINAHSMVIREGIHSTLSTLASKILDLTK